MIGLGTIINTVAVVAGGLLGMLLKNGIAKRFEKILMQALGLAVIFIGINGVDEEFGFSTPRYVDADVKRCMLHSAHCSIVLADHTKLGKTYLAKIAKPDYLITDEMLAGFAYENLTGTTVIFANERIHGGTTQYEAANR